MGKETWMFLIGMLSAIVIVAMLVSGIRGCSEEQSKLYLQCVQSMHGHSGDEVVQACNKVKD